MNELRVVDLREELGKRGLDKSGNKKALLERLQKAVEAEKNNQEASQETPSSSLGNEQLQVDVLVDLSPSRISKNDSEHDISALVDGESSPKVISQLDQDINENYDNKKLDSPECSSLTTNESVDLKIKSEPEQRKEDEDSSETKKTIVKSEPVVVTEEILPAEKKEVKTEETIVKTVTTVTSRMDDKSVAGTIGDGDAAEKSSPSDGKSDGKSEGKSEGKSASSVPSKSIKDRLTNKENRNLWITNIAQSTPAAELKQALSPHGKVVGAKVVINARHPTACCYGYVRMETIEDADNCIAKLNNTELNGQIIRIEKVTPDHLNPIKSQAETKEKEKPSQRNPITAPSPSPPKNGGVGTADNNRDKPPDKGRGGQEGDRKRKPIEAPKRERSDHGKERKQKRSDDQKFNRRHSSSSTRTKSLDRNSERNSERSSRTRRSDSKDVNQGKSRNRALANERTMAEKAVIRDRARSRDMLTFDKIKDEREREQRRAEERDIRNRQREESEELRLLEKEREQRSEFVRLQRENERERERIRLERSKLEREKLEIERIALEQEKLRFQQERRAIKRAAPTHFRERESESERPYVDRKRIAPERHFEEAPAPPAPRYGTTSIRARDPPPIVKKFVPDISVSLHYPAKDYLKRRPHANYEKHNYDERSRPAISRAAPQAAPQKYRSQSPFSHVRVTRTANSTQPGSSASDANGKYSSRESKESYSDRDRTRNVHYSRTREERRREPEPKVAETRTSRTNHGYFEQRDAMRYDRSASGSTPWSASKVASSSTSSSTMKRWDGDSYRSENASSGDRWTGGGTSRNSSSSMSSGYPSNSNLGSMGMSYPPPPGLGSYVNDRFDYKSSSVHRIRKY